MFEVAPEEEHGDKRCRHNFYIGHFLLPILPMVKCFQEVVTYTIDRQDVVVHGGLLVQG
jgi:hypothetical protein